MDSLVRYCWDTGTQLVYDKKAQTVQTYFVDGSFTGGAVVPEDKEHALLLNITMIEHRLLHELAHSEIAKALGYRDCPILWAAAHNEDMPENASELEWYFTVLSYVAYFTAQRHPDGWKTLTELIHKGLDPVKMAQRLRWLVEASRFGGMSIYIGT